MLEIAWFFFQKSENVQKMFTGCHIPRPSSYWPQKTTLKRFKLESKIDFNFNKYIGATFGDIQNVSRKVDF